MENPYEKLVDRELPQKEIKKMGSDLVGYFQLLIEVDRQQTADRLNYEKERNRNN